MPYILQDDYPLDAMRTFQQFTEEVQRALKKRDEKSKREKKVDKLKSDSSHWKGLE